jgi:formylmethanofuran dehydrogenase subunit E
MDPGLQQLLERSAKRHSHLCPRQVLGVRMGIAGTAALGLDVPICRQSGLVIVETDGCFVDGIEVATGATVGHRTLRVGDYGKIAATFVDATSGRAVRLWPRNQAREEAASWAADAANPYDAQVIGYQRMPEAELFHREQVVLTRSVDALISQPEIRVNCDSCGEEIFNERQVVVGDGILCRPCAAGGYYLPAERNHLEPDRGVNVPAYG